MFKGIIRLLAFFSKEVNEIRRQPKLVLSLILGPFLILLLFGVGYQGNQPKLRTALVVPQSLINTPVLQQMTDAMKANFEVVDVGTDRGAALDKLVKGSIAVVEIIPDDVQNTVLDGQQGQVEFKYNEINPLNAQWIQYLGYAQVTELNKTILRNQADQLKTESGQTDKELADAKAQLDLLNQNVSSANPQQVQASARRLKEALDVISANPVLATQISASGNNPQQTQQQIQQLRSDLDEIDKAAGNGTLAQQKARIQSASQRVGELQGVTGKLAKLPSEVIVSPLQQTYENVYGTLPDFMTFYAPGVLALIVQHIAVTLGALSLVRERLLGAIEFYGVAPVWLTQVLVGKYMAYTLFIGIIIAALVGLMLAIGVPFAGDPLLFAGLALLLVLASLGIGFVISSISSSDSQAVQLSMIVLLLSIFFSGFFLPLENFNEYVRPISLLIPLTQGIAGFQDIMLRGSVPNQLIWAVLATIAGVTFVVVQVVWRRQFRQIA